MTDVPLSTSGRTRVILTASTLGAVSLILGYLVWSAGDPFWLFAGLVPLACAVGSGWFEARLTPEWAGKGSPIGRRLGVFALAALCGGWGLIPVLEAEAIRNARNKSYGPVHGIVVAGEVREFRPLLKSAAVIWFLAAAVAFLSALLTRAPPAWTLAVIALLHFLFAAAWSVWPLD
jgi:hypothetical protein